MWTTLRRYWLRTRVSDGPMGDFLATPLPSSRADVHATDFLALDLETTGLDPAADQIASIGYVPIRAGRVCMTGAQHTLVRIDGSVEQSATIHGIVDAELDDAVPLEAALTELLDALKNRVLVLHHAPLDLRFLHAACQRLWDVPLNIRVVDTLALGQRRRPNTRSEPREGEFRLHALRHQYGLPRYPAHNALSDALATAELFLAMAAHWSGDDALPLRTLLR